MAGLYPFSIVIPTYREAKNIPELIRRIATVDFHGTPFEVILVDDDSQDGIDTAVEKLQQQFAWLRLIIRKSKRSLNQSIIDGFKQAKNPFFVAMDADLSHPPERIPAMLQLLQEPRNDFVIGSRYVPGGSTDPRWPFARKMTSCLAAAITSLVVSVPVKDPLSGFFALRRETFIASDPLDAIGWKIALELMVKCRCQHIQEIPIHFSERFLGKSKFNLKIAGEYFHHITRLLIYKMGKLIHKSK